MRRVALFYHSLVSDWNHGNAHFLRGIATNMVGRGIEVKIYEPVDSWSRLNLIQHHGNEPVRRFHESYPSIESGAYHLSDLELERKLDGVDLALVHEWNDPRLIAAINDYQRRNKRLTVFFHDTHHRAVTAPQELSRFDLSEFDGILVYGASLARAYEERGWGKRIFVWHEAADTTVFYPRPQIAKAEDLVWVGNWGDDERTQELSEFLITPAAHLGIRGSIYGVRYPEEAIRTLAEAGLSYRGWTANFDVPGIFARHRVTVHIPRRPYARQLSGIPTIRPFEAMACGIPMISAPWNDSENLFRPGIDYLLARDGQEMRRLLREVLNDDGLACSLASHGLETVLARHTCGHRVDELIRHYDAVQKGLLAPENQTVCI